jgi:hypothetical protein
MEKLIFPMADGYVFSLFERKCIALATINALLGVLGVLAVRQV